MSRKTHFADRNEEVVESSVFLVYFVGRFMQKAKMSRCVWPARTLAGLVFGLHFAFASTSLALPVVDGDFRLDVPLDEEPSCVLAPESASEDEGCEGIERASVRARLVAGVGEKLELVSAILVMGDSPYLFTVLRDGDARTEFDKASQRAFAQSVRDRMSKKGGDSSLAGDPVESRIRGVQIISFETAAKYPSDDPGYAFSHTLFYIASTSRGVYTISLSGSPENTDEMRATAGEMLSTLHAKPAIAPAAARAGAIGDLIYYAMVAVAQVAAIVTVIVLVVRQRRKQGQQVGQPFVPSADGRWHPPRDG